MISLLRKGLGVPVCPEVLGGLSVPRDPAEIIHKGGDRSVLRGASVRTAGGIDVTRQYVDGALRSLSVGLQFGCSKAVLKARSPSCGLGMVYDGTFSRRLTEGHGVFAELLLSHGIQVYSEDDLEGLELTG